MSQIIRNKWAKYQSTFYSLQNSKEHKRRKNSFYTLTLMCTTCISLFNFALADELVLKSIAQQDGVVLENPSLNNTGAFVQANRGGISALSIGDMSDNRQIKTFVSFDTSLLPPDAVLTDVRVRLKAAMTVGENPFQGLGPCIVDVNSGGFSGNVALESADFQAAATASAAGSLRAVSRPGEWTEASLNASGIAAINRAGVTQVRAYCSIDDNNNSTKDAVNFAPGEETGISPELVVTYTIGAVEMEHSVARQWNEELLQSIRKDFARPTVHARNLFHISAAMWDAWAAYDPNAGQVLHHEKMPAVADIKAARNEAISYASYRILNFRFASSPGAAERLPMFDAKMDELGYDRNFTSTEGSSAAALGNRIAETIIDFGQHDKSNEVDNFANLWYQPVNPALLPEFPGNPNIEDPNRWQPLSLEFFIDQSGNLIPGGSLAFLSPEWGQVSNFAMSDEDLTIYNRDGFDYYVYHDPGAPPAFGTDAYRSGFQQVLEWSGELDPSDGVLIDISPASRGNNTLGTNDGHGRDVNPVTGLPYEQQLVPAGDYFRVLAEFWADGPDSETPPGHWFAVANYVMDHELHENRFGGAGNVLDALEYDIKVYLTLGGAMHDAAVSAWGVKGNYDYIRPVSAIRHMCDLGQSSDSSAPSYDPGGIGLVAGKIELVTAETVAPGGIHEHLAGENNENIGKIAAYAWRGPDFIQDPDTDTAGVDWILCENWWPYQRPSFVTPPFAGYVSGHSTFSRAAAEVMTLVTGDEYFPGGMGIFDAPKNEFLVFEEGPSVDVQLQWATYRDASDETSISRIYGGIHPTADDIPGRLMGAEIGPDAYEHALKYFRGELGILPTVTILGDIEGRVYQPGQPIVLSATAFDSNNLNLSRNIVWQSSIDGELGVGERLILTNLSSGVHTITATATDRNGQTTEITFQIAVGSQEPTIELIGPSDDTRVDQGVEIVFTAKAEDFEEGDISHLINWMSDIDGLIGVGGSLSLTSLSPGKHIITATVSDMDAHSASDSTFITIYGAISNVDLVFTSNPQQDGFIIEASETSNTGGVAVSFLGGGGALRLGDTNKDQQVKFITSFDLTLPAGSVISSASLNLYRGGRSGENPFNVLGPCFVDLHSSGFSGDTSLQISDFEAAASVAQVATLNQPNDGTNWYRAGLNQAGIDALINGQTVQMRVACTTDDNDNSIEDSQSFNSGEFVEADKHPQLILTMLNDSVNTAPTVIIHTPANDVRVALGESILFDASATDEEDGDISPSIIWRSNIDGILAEGEIFTTDVLSQGSHVITAEVLDSEFVPARQSIIVNVGVDLTPMFTDATSSAGLDIISGAAGLAAGDYDNDGCVDLALTPRSGTKSVTLLKSNCDGTFSDVSTQANIGVTGRSGSGLAWGDYDNDGYLDLYVANPNAIEVRAELWHNLGNGTFVEVSASAGIAGTTGSVGVSWNDFDGDNDLDIFIASRYGDSPADVLYQNDGNGHFVNVAEALGIDGLPDPGTPNARARLTYMGAWADFDQNLSQDLWLSVDFGTDVLYRNSDGVLTDDSIAAGLSDSATHGMGITVGDPNGDGCLDVLVTNNGGPASTDPKASYLHRNNCDGTFTSIGEESGILLRNVTEWGTSFVDFDNDGDEDLSIVAGGISGGEEANVLYQNVTDSDGQLKMIDVTEATGTAGLGNSRGAIWFDFDEDGDMDWLIANSNNVVLLRNDGPTGNYLKVKLAGSVSNSYGIGARVEITVDGKTIVRYLRSGHSFASSEEIEAAFGIGDATQVQQVVVKWPSGVVDTLGPISANSLLLVQEGLYP